jgi:hypothetical protein
MGAYVDCMPYRDFCAKFLKPRPVMKATYFVIHRNYLTYKMHL